MQIYLDGCDLKEIKKYNSSNKISGFTTNPSLMASAGVKNYESFSKKLLSAKKPIVIIGESALELKSGKYIFEEMKNFLAKNNFINKEKVALILGDNFFY